MSDGSTKVSWKPGTLLTPVPAVMVSCGESPETYNIITIAWTGIVNSKPPMTYISIRPERHSHHIIKETGEFVINITTRHLAKATDWCGVKSGKEFNKFEEMKLTPEPSAKVKCPAIAESPLTLECKVTEIKNLGSHDMFLAEIIAVNADEKYINKDTGEFQIEFSDPITYMHGNYYNVGKRIGKFGFSVMKKSTQRKRRKAMRNKTNQKSK